MYSIDLMMSEHIYIRRMMAVMAASLKTGMIDSEEWEHIIAFLQDYADEHHHRKEEKILFPEMIKTIGGMVEGIIEGVMLVEHEEGRKHVRGMIHGLEAYKTAPTKVHFDRIEQDVNRYIQILGEHTEKEDRILYQMALVHLTEEAKEEVDRLCQKAEDRDTALQVQKTHLSFLEHMENKYNIHYNE